MSDSPVIASNAKQSGAPRDRHGRERPRDDILDNENDDKGLYDELDEAKNRGRGSCCTEWSFLLLLATLLVIGIVVILFV